MKASERVGRFLSEETSNLSNFHVTRDSIGVATWIISAQRSTK